MYKDTRCTVKIKEKLIGSFRTGRGVRQECPLIPSIFNVLFSELEEFMSTEQKGGIVIGRYKI